MACESCMQHWNIRVHKYKHRHTIYSHTISYMAVLSQQGKNVIVFTETWEPTKSKVFNIRPFIENNWESIVQPFWLDAVYAKIYSDVL